MILPIAMTRIDFDLVDLNQVSGRITDCRVDPEAFNELWFGRRSESEDQSSDGI